MTKSLAITERQVTALCKGAAKAGHVAIVKIGDTVVRLVPKDQVTEDVKVDAKRKGYL